jgi:hypothetical protein
MTDNELTTLPAPVFAGGTKAITLTPIVGTPLTPAAVAPPAWWAEARIPLDDAPLPG